MYKIFKYPCGWDGNIKKWVAFCPYGSIIRTEFIDDGTYKGFYLWVIVNTESLLNVRREFNWATYAFTLPYNWIQLGILEEQKIEIPIESNVYGIKVDQGKIYLGVYRSESTCQSRNIVGYKTGQEMKYPSGHLRYLGFAPLFIKNEIAIYFFEVM